MSDTGWLEKLNAENFLGVCDVLIDIDQEMQIATDRTHVTIPIWQPIIKFSQLFPGDSIGMRDRYCELRWKIAKFLESQGVVGSVTARDGGYHRWETLLEITLNADRVAQAVTQMNMEYRRRMPDIPPSNLAGKVFIGHGQSPTWKDLRDFLRDRLHVDWIEFNRNPVAGYATMERLEQMLAESSFAFLVMTAEEERPDGKLYARDNVIHELGLFQGRLGFKRAIILLEEGCSEFSNIIGLSQIRFPKGNVIAKSEDIRQVLEREGVLTEAS